MYVWQNLANDGCFHGPYDQAASFPNFYSLMQVVDV